MTRATILAALLVACTGPMAPSDAMQPSVEAGTPRVEIGTRESGARFTPWHDGDTIPLVWGSQGGVMITPAVAIDGSLISAVDPALIVTVTNLRAADHAPFIEFPGVGPLRALFARLDARLVDGPIFDQLGWSETPGLRMIVQARVTGMGVDAIGEVAIVIGPSGTTAPDASAFDGHDGGAIDAGL